VDAVKQIDIGTVLTEGLTEKTIDKMKRAEAMLGKMFEKYNLAEDDQRQLTEALQEYAEGIYGDVYDMALKAGAELGDMRGYRMAMAEAEDVAAGMLAEVLAKRGNVRLE